VKFRNDVDMIRNRRSNMISSIGSRS